ncbi:YSIRK-type signal peptide-containing protein, partial [Staphylococcus ureilyticus]
MKKEKFSIRKYKMGASSVLLGTCLAISIGNVGEAHASETKHYEASNNLNHSETVDGGQLSKKEKNLVINNAETPKENTVNPDTVSSDEKNVDNNVISSTTEEKSNTNTVNPDTVSSDEKNVDNNVIS